MSGVPSPRYRIGQHVWVRHGNLRTRYEATIVNVEFVGGLPVWRYRIRWCSTNVHQPVFDEKHVWEYEVYEEKIRIRRIKKSYKPGDYDTK